MTSPFPDDQFEVNLAPTVMSATKAAGAIPSSSGPWSPSSAASEDTEATLPTAASASAVGVGLRSEEEALAAALHANEDIRFATYRTSAKLRALQKQTHLHHIDIWNVIEAFRETGWHTMDPSAKIGEDDVGALIKALYDALQKRLPPSATAGAAAGENAAEGGSSGGSCSGSGGGGNGQGQGAVLKSKSTLLKAFLWQALSRPQHQPGGSHIKMRTAKTALATLCTGKLMDKLRYVFSQVSDSNGHLVHSKFAQFLRDIMKIPAAVGEFTDGGSSVNEVVFDPSEKINVNDFLETMMSDPGPQCLSWLLVLHRIINSEGVFHSVSCGNCLLQGFHGLRYKSDRSNYHLCQNCFWRGKIGADHLDDVFKEFNSFKSSSSGRASFKKNLQCIPSGGDKRTRLPHFPDAPEKPLDLSNMVPPPMTARNGFARGDSGSGSQGLYRPTTYAAVDAQDEFFGMQPDPYASLGSVGAGGDEHSLIAQYANQLAYPNPGGESGEAAGASMSSWKDSRSRSAGSTSSRGTGDAQAAEPGRRALQHSRQIVHDLEKRNREIMRDINQLRQSHSLEMDERASNPDSVMSELHHLRSHKDVLEERLQELHETRQALMHELGELMKLLQLQAPHNDQAQQAQQQGPQFYHANAGAADGRLQ